MPKFKLRKSQIPNDKANRKHMYQILRWSNHYKILHLYGHFYHVNVVYKFGQKNLLIAMKILTDPSILFHHYTTEEKMVLLKFKPANGGSSKLTSNKDLLKKRKKNSIFYLKCSIRKKKEKSVHGYCLVKKWTLDITLIIINL